MERRFGRPHPAMEEFREPRKEFYWLVDAFFRLHRRRMHGESGYQPIPVKEITGFSDDVLRLQEGLRRLFIRTMEETDNAVLYDHYSKVRDDQEKAKSEIESARKSSGKRRRK